MRLSIIAAAAFLQMVGSSPACAQAPSAASEALRPGAAQRLEPTGRIDWPGNEGFAAAPVLIVLPAGMLLDRFGSEQGRFFSPRGADFAGRALPYACSGAPYTTYRVTAPLLVWAGRAAPWFGEPGGATQVETDATAAQLVADHTLERAPPSYSFACEVGTGGHPIPGAPTTAAPAPIPLRTPLASLPIAPGKTVTHVETTRVDFAPGQTMPRHKHTAPVVCFVTAGEFRVKIGDAPERRAAKGSVTVEPAGTVVGYFRNASSSAPAQLDCAALAGDGDRELNVMLPER